jgi:oxygen-independent coproporphyrinogen-3 oxidase
LPLTTVLRELEDAGRRGLIERDHARIAPTALGRRYLNDLLQLFLAPEKHVPHPVTES